MGTSVVILTIVIIVCSIVGSIAQATLSGITAKVMDLCPVCQDSIESWLYLKPKEAAGEEETK